MTSIPSISGQAPLPAPTEPGVDAYGVRVVARADAVLDVLFDGRRIWSIDPATRALANGTFVPWPEALEPYLEGVARVTIREHARGEVVFEGELAVGSSPERIVVADDEGRPLSVSKWGELVEPFEAAGEGAIASMLDLTAQALEVLRDHCGVPSFVTYGTLLGAVREGKLLGHDDDVDIAYLSPHRHPADVMRESFAIQRTFHRLGWHVRRFSGGFLQVSRLAPDGRVRPVDVFTCFHTLGRFYQLFAVGADLERSAIVPVGSVTLEGRRLPAPADPAALLEATYGAGWRVPDPGFTFKVARETRRRLNGWLGGYHLHAKSWNGFYRSPRASAVPDQPSAFARWVAAREPAADIVEIGCGTGRDALWFAGEGHRVIGLDYSPTAIERVRSTAQARGVAARFQVFDLYDLREVLTLGAHIAHWERSPLLYGRFLLHSLEDAARLNLWRLGATAMRPGGRLYLEFRTIADEGRPHSFGEHFRRFLDPDAVIAEISAQRGVVEHREEGRGLAVYREEDPPVCRVVVSWRQ